MLVVNPVPYSIPLNSANVPTESVETQNNVAERIPESGATFNIPNKKAAETEQKSNGATRNGQSFELRDSIFSDRGAASSNTQSTSTQNTGSNQAVGENTASDVATTSTAPSDSSQGTSSQGENTQTAEIRREQAQLVADQSLIQKLVASDRRVKAHEQAHSSVGGALAGAPSYTYQTGPNGVRYAIGGEVSIDTSGVPGDPQATVRKSEQVVRAALAPADPSSTDQRVAASAQALASKARFEIAQQTVQSSQASATGDDEEGQEEEILESSTSFGGTRLRSALASDATDQVGGQVSASV